MGEEASAQESNYDLDLSPNHSLRYSRSQNNSSSSLSERHIHSSSEETANEKVGSESEKPLGASDVSNGMTWEDWKALPLKFAKVYLIIFCMWLGLLSIYWGSLHHREDRVKNMKIIVAIEDSPTQLSNTSYADPAIGPHFVNLLEASGRLGHYVLANVTELKQTASAKNKTITELLESLVHEHKYWAALHVSNDSSTTAYELMLSANTSSPAAKRAELAITAIYESGRHFSALSQYVTKNLRTLQLDWTNVYAPLAYGDIVRSYLTESEREQLVASANSSSTGAVFAYLPSFDLMDLRPALSSAVLGPSELGLVYAQIFSFHQFNFSADLHNAVRERLRFRHFLWYRILFSQVNHIMLALIYGLMTIAFQVPTNVAYGRSGFLVLWATMYMFISASGGLNECAGTLIAYYDKKILLPPWIIATIVLNISPTFAPFVLSPGFYRYGNAMPMFNAYEALKVVFFNTWKGTLGLNYGVLAAWMVVTNIGLCLILLYLSRKSRKLKMQESQD